MARQGGGARRVRARARSALLVAALAVEVGSFACAGAQPDGTLPEASTASTPVEGSAQPDPPIGEPSLACPKSRSLPKQTASASPGAEQEVSGTLIVRCIITVSGTVKDCCIIQGLPHVARPVIDGLQAQRARPIIANGKPVEVDYTWTFRLRAPDKDAPAPAAPSSP